MWMPNAGLQVNNLMRLKEDKLKKKIIFLLYFYIKFFFVGTVVDRELEGIHDRYMNCLKTFIEFNFPQEPNRVQDLLVKLPEV